jgi:hypothetical protein
MFGKVGLEVHAARGHVLIHTFRRGPVGPVPHAFALHGVDEIDSALSAWANKPGPEAANMRGALRFAGKALAAPKARRR